MVTPAPSEGEGLAGLRLAGRRDGAAAGELWNCRGAHESAPSDQMLRYVGHSTIDRQRRTPDPLRFCENVDHEVLFGPEFAGVKAEVIDTIVSEL